MGIPLKEFKQSVSAMNGNETFIDKKDLKHLQAIKEVAQEIHMVYTYLPEETKRMEKLMKKLGELLLKENYAKT